MALDPPCRRIASSVPAQHRERTSDQWWYPSRQEGPQVRVFRRPQLRRMTVEVDPPVLQQDEVDVLGLVGRHNREAVVTAQRLVGRHVERIRQMVSNED